MGIMLCWLLATLMFAVLPVPFSAIMAERQVSLWASGHFSQTVHSRWVAHQKISPWVKLAVIASEDQRFPQHWGFDLSAIQAALAHNQENPDTIRGASTISQQTAKNLFLWEGRSWLRKVIEAPLTVLLETFWSKQRILTVYLNIAQFGPNLYGIEAAAQFYFQRSAANLTEQQAARLAAVLPNPLIYHANRPSAYLLRREHWILRQMQQLGGKAFLQKYRLN